MPNVNVTSTARRPSNTPSSGLSQQVTTSAALPSRIGQRMRWTKEMNINVMRAYFRATKCESQTTGYRTLFYNEWKIIYPTS